MVIYVSDLITKATQYNLNGGERELYYILATKLNMYWSEVPAWIRCSYDLQLWNFSAKWHHTSINWGGCSFVFSKSSEAICVSKS